MSNNLIIQIIAASALLIAVATSGAFNYIGFVKSAQEVSLLTTQVKALRDAAPDRSATGQASLAPTHSQPTNITFSQEQIDQIAAALLLRLDRGVLANAGTAATAQANEAQAKKDADQQQLQEASYDNLVERAQDASYLASKTFQDLQADADMQQLPPQEQVRLINEHILPTLQSLGPEAAQRFFNADEPTPAP